MATALQRLRDNVKEQETFEEKVKRNPAEVLRELYSSEEYKNYESMKHAFGGNPYNFYNSAYDLSDEFKAKERMAWEELRKIREEEEKLLNKKIKDEGITNLESIEEIERNFRDRWTQIYEYIYGRSKENPLADQSNNKEEDFRMMVSKIDNEEEFYNRFDRDVGDIKTISNDTNKENIATSQNNVKEESPKEETKQASESVKEVEKKTEDSPVYKAIATHKGVVSDVGNDYVKVRYSDKGKIYEENFKGLKEINVKKGDRVKEGQVIGQSDKEINVEKKVVASAGHHHKHHHHKHHHHHNHHHNNHKAGHNENQKVKVERKNENANATNPNNISSKIPGADIIFSSMTSGGQNQVSFGNIKDQIKLERNQNILINKPEEPKVAMSVAPGM